MNFWKWFLKSLYDKKVLAYSRFRPITSTLWHVLFSVLLSSIPFLITMNQTAYVGVHSLHDLLSHNLPSFKIINGTLVLDDEDKYQTVHGNTEIIIDSRFLNTDEIAHDIKNGIVLMRNQLVMIKNGHTQTFPYTLLGVSDLTKEQLAQRVADLKGFLPILLVIASFFIYLGLSGLVFLGITILAFVGQIFRGARKNLEYRHLWSMSAHAMTLPVIILNWMDNLLIQIPLSIFIVTSFIFLLMAISSVPFPKNFNKLPKG